MRNECNDKAFPIIYFGYFLLFYRFMSPPMGRHFVIVFLFLFKVSDSKLVHINLLYNDRK